MQRITFFLAVLFFATLGLTAQTALGLRLGYATTSVESTQGLDLVTNQLGNLGSPEIAVFADVNISRGLSFQPELQYTSRGFALDLGTDATVAGINVPIGATARSRFHYIEAPLLLKAAFGDATTQAYFIAGPSVGYAVGGNLTTRARAIFEFDLIDTPINLGDINYQRLSVSGIAGVGAQHNLTPGIRIFGDVRYTHGFTELYDIPVLTETLSNRAIGGNIGLAFVL